MSARTIVGGVSGIDNEAQQPTTEKEKLLKSTIGERIYYFCRYHWAGLIVFTTPLALMPLLYAVPTSEYRCAYVLCLMAVYWISEALPLYVTALLPIILFPIMGILDSESVCQMYFSNSVILFFGSLIVALAIEYCNLHKRVAFFVILRTGFNPRKLQFSLLLVTMFVSMWVSNSAATSLMCPIIKAILSELSNERVLSLVDTKASKQTADEQTKPSKAVTSYYLSAAYAASIGGCATLIGTGSNIGFKGIFERRFPASLDINFMSFLLYTLPAMLLCIVLVYIWLQWLHFGLFQPDSEDAKQIKMCSEHDETANVELRKRHLELGPITTHELQVALLFVLMIVAFVTRSPGWFTGWADLLTPIAVKNSLSVMVIVMLLFMLPVNYNFIKHLIRPGMAVEQLRETPSLLNWHFVNEHMHWGLLLLTGGGLVLAEGISVSGLAIMVGRSFPALQELPAPLVQLICICSATLLTTFASNVAICNMITPILIEIALSIHVHPLYLSLPTCLAVSMSFLLPISTPSNAIVTAWANISSKDMFIAGSVPCLIGIFAIFITSQTLAYWIFPGFNYFPDWALTSTVQP